MKTPLKVPVSRPRILRRDIKSVVAALKGLELSGHSSTVSEFEDALATYLKTQHVVAVSSGTSALDLLADYLNIGPKDTIVAPTFTIISTISEVIRRGAKVLLVDSTPDTWCLDVTQVVEEIERAKKVSAIYGTHIYNSVFDAELLLRVAEDNNTLLVEDAAEALGSSINQKMLGTFGHFGIFSFYANKLITTGEGGAIVAQDALASKEIGQLRNLGFNPDQRFLHNRLGRNTRMSGLSASLGISQLKSAEQFRLHRTSLHQLYMVHLGALEGIRFQKTIVDQASFIPSYWVMPILLEKETGIDAKILQELLARRGVETRRFFCPMHLQPALKKANIQLMGDMQISESLWHGGLYLPMGSGISKKEVEYVCEVIKNILDSL
jgi:perosamine synthetase